MNQLFPSLPVDPERRLQGVCVRASFASLFVLCVLFSSAAASCEAAETDLPENGGVWYASAYTHDWLLAPGLHAFPPFTVIYHDGTILYVDRNRYLERSMLRQYLTAKLGDKAFQEIRKKLMIPKERSLLSIGYDVSFGASPQPATVFVRLDDQEARFRWIKGLDAQFLSPDSEQNEVYNFFEARRQALPEQIRSLFDANVELLDLAPSDKKEWIPKKLEILQWKPDSYVRIYPGTWPKDAPAFSKLAWQTPRKRFYQEGVEKVARIEGKYVTTFRKAMEESRRSKTGRPHGASYPMRLPNGVIVSARQAFPDEDAIVESFRRWCGSFPEGKERLVTLPVPPDYGKRLPHDGDLEDPFAGEDPFAPIEEGGKTGSEE